MHPITHLLTGWALANAFRLERRERAVVTLAAVIPDIDGLGIIPELLTQGSAHPLTWGSDYHRLLHNLTFCLAVSAAGMFFVKRRWKVGALTLLSLHLHLLFDLLGSRGPEDGYLWPVPYLWPFIRDREPAWNGQWAINAWPNIALTVLLLAAAFRLAWKRGFSPFELLSSKLDRLFVEALRRRFGEASRRAPE